MTRRRGQSLDQLRELQQAINQSAAMLHEGPQPSERVLEPVVHMKMRNGWRYMERMGVGWIPPTGPLRRPFRGAPLPVAMEYTREYELAEMAANTVTSVNFTLAKTSETIDYRNRTRKREYWYEET